MNADLHLTPAWTSLDSLPLSVHLQYVLWKVHSPSGMHQNLVFLPRKGNMWLGVTS